MAANQSLTLLAKAGQSGGIGFSLTVISGVAGLVPVGLGALPDTRIGMYVSRTLTGSIGCIVRLLE